MPVTESRSAWGYDNNYDGGYLHNLYDGGYDIDDAGYNVDDNDLLVHYDIDNDIDVNHNDDIASSSWAERVVGEDWCVMGFDTCCEGGAVERPLDN